MTWTFPQVQDFGIFCLIFLNYEVLAGTMSEIPQNISAPTVLPT